MDHDKYDAEQAVASLVRMLDLPEAEQAWARMCGQELYEIALRKSEEGGRRLSRKLSPTVIPAMLAYALDVARRLESR
jgi:hypothetical protein